jgi:hypothetical protein
MEQEGLEMTERYLFRGKRLDNGEWETGNIVVTRQGYHDGLCYISDKMTGYPTPIDPATIGACTGLRDKNGTLIFESDLVEWVDSDTHKRTDAVTWTSNCCLSLCNSAHSIGTYSGNELEVVGNLYDNREFVEVKNGK